MRSAPTPPPESWEPDPPRISPLRAALIVGSLLLVGVGVLLGWPDATPSAAPADASPTPAVTVTIRERLPAPITSTPPAASPSPRVSRTPVGSPASPRPTVTVTQRVPAPKATTTAPRRPARSPTPAASTELPFTGPTEAPPVPEWCPPGTIVNEFGGCSPDQPPPPPGS
ncbi:hypothetical protein [Planobispora rosea]|nr:hypothetical protein [Planobispora rosea]